jgi:hypothetical protein
MGEIQFFPFFPIFFDAGSDFKEKLERDIAYAESSTFVFRRKCLKISKLHL